MKFQIKGSSCNVIHFDGSDLLSSVITCQTKSSQAKANDYYGNRGINLQVQNVFTQFTYLGSAVPASNAQLSWLDVASYQYPNSSDATVWLTGYLAPSVSSDYLLLLTTNAYAKLYLSTDSNSANKVYENNVIIQILKLYYKFLILATSCILRSINEFKCFTNTHITRWSNVLFTGYCFKNRRWINH